MKNICTIIGVTLVLLAGLLIGYIGFTLGIGGMTTHIFGGLSLLIGAVLIIVGDVLGKGQQRRAEEMKIVGANIEATKKNIHEQLERDRQSREKILNNLHKTN